MFYIINHELTPTQLTFSFYTDDFNIYTLRKEIKIIRNGINLDDFQKSFIDFKSLLNPICTSLVYKNCCLFTALSTTNGYLKYLP